MNGQVKLTEIWKSLHIEAYPIKSSQLSTHPDEINTRARVTGQLKEFKVTHKSEKNIQLIFTNMVKLFDTFSSTINKLP